MGEQVAAGPPLAHGASEQVCETHPVLSQQSYVGEPRGPKKGPHRGPPLQGSYLQESQQASSEGWEGHFPS